MTKAISLDGKEYISASRAAEKIGYSNDYIGQLCRSRKIPGKLIGKAWYVEFRALHEHRKTRKLGKPDSSKTDQQKIDFLSAQVFPARYLIHVADQSPSSGQDETPLLPPLAKKIRQSEPHWKRLFLHESIAILLVFILSVSISSLFLDIKRSQLTAAPLFNTLDNSLGHIVLAWRDLKETVLK